MQPNRFLQMLLVFMLGAGDVRLIADTPAKATPKAENPTFGDFSQRVEQYLKLRKVLPNERTSKRQDQIVDRRQALAQAIRESRAGTKQGDIFTPAISEQFLRVIRGTL